MNYSQYEEQRVALEFFNKQASGFFLDIGASDGVNLSNTRALWEMGWGGMLVEPNHHAFAALQKAYLDADRIVLVNAAICEHNGPVTFYEHDTSGWSSLDKRWVEQQGGFRKRTVLGLKLESLGLGSQVDFISIDTEGKDADILEALPEQMRPKLIMAEIDKFDSHERILRALQALGYKEIWKGVGNAAYAHEN